MIPRTAAAGEVCPYHRIVNLSRDLRYRVTADCYDPAQIVRMPMFILPPAQEWYYRKQHPDYRPLPPLHPGLSGSGAGGNPIDIVYPQPGRVLVAPKSLEGEAQSLVFTAIHRDRNAVLYWHIDDNYIGATTLEHKISTNTGRGKASRSAAADRSLWLLAGAEGLCAGCRSVLSGGAEAGLPGGGLSRMGVFGGTGLFRSFGTGFSGLSSFL